MASNIVDLTTPAEILSPATSKVTLASNYINFTDSSFNQWAQQYLPEIYESEVERYGNRSLASFLRLVGAEMPMSSDQVIWSEQGRLHIKLSATVNDGSANTFTLTSGHSLRVGQTVLLSFTDATSPTAAYTTARGKGYVSVVGATSATILPYEYADWDALVTAATSPATTITADGDAVTMFVYGSEFGKGTSGMAESIQPEVKVFNNKPIIIKDKFEVSGSDAAQIGWIEVSGEAGQSGYLWYMKAEGDTRTRFEDYLEMSLVEAVKGVQDLDTGSPGDQNSAAYAAGFHGTEGLFSAIENRGIVSDGFGVAAATTALEFQSSLDNMCIELDKQGAIEENMLFLNRSGSLGIDSGLALLNSNTSGGTSYGVFENSEDMALNLGFSGFRRGSYDFYKTDWKYLNDQSTRGAIGGVEGVLVPAGTSSVYDQMMGKNIRRPFLHVRYRASEMDNRRMKSWVVGSVGATNSDLDAMEIHYLSERCLVTQAANNFILFNDTDA